jgi:hypothetical protein
MDAAKAKRWAQRLSRRVEKVLVAHPRADRDTVRQTFILLELPPFERLQRSLIRGRAMAKSKKVQPNGGRPASPLAKTPKRVLNYE